MDFLSWIYLAVFVLALGVLIFVRLQLVFTARPNRFLVGFYAVAAVMIGGFTVASSHTVADYISGFFIAGMLALFALWRRGVTADSLITGVGRVTGLYTLAAVQLTTVAGGCVLEATVGTVTVARLQLRQSAETVAAFLGERMEPKRVVIVQ